ncbi:hypothetical protein TNCV_2905311 [Trichonephila clavipes]|nr:hypothetical protein TNCV_2905311 [Trichonephila clavipes]
MSPSPVPLKTRHVRERYSLNLSRAQTSSRWCGEVVRRGIPAQVSSSSLDHGSKIRGPFAKISRVAEQCDINVHSLIVITNCHFAAFMCVATLRSQVVSQ